MSSSPELPGSIPQKPQLWNSAYVRQKQQKKLKPVTYPPDLWLPYNLAINKILALSSPSCPVSTNNQLLRCNPIKSHTWTAQLQAGPSREKYNSWSSVLGKDKEKKKKNTTLVMLESTGSQFRQGTRSTPWYIQSIFPTAWFLSSFCACITAGRVFNW